MTRIYKRLFEDAGLLNEMLELAKQGYSQNALAKRYKCDRSSIKYQIEASRKPKIIKLPKERLKILKYREPREEKPIIVRSYRQCDYKREKTIEALNITTQIKIHYSKVRTCECGERFIEIGREIKMNYSRKSCPRCVPYKVAHINIKSSLKN